MVVSGMHKEIPLWLSNKKKEINLRETIEENSQNTATRQTPQVSLKTSKFVSREYRKIWRLSRNPQIYAILFCIRSQEPSEMGEKLVHL